MAALDNLLGFNGTFGTGSPAEEAEKPVGPVGNLLLGLARSAATLPQRAIQNSQFALNTGNYDPSVPMEAALGLTGGAGIVPAEANSLRMGIKAYHGSPHDFDAFSMDKIGTGEGAQAYGHGLYFADNEGVAQSYKKTLAPASADVAPSWKGDGWQVTTRDGGNFDRQFFPTKQEAEAHAAQFDKGHMYEVNINADPAHFLDWDKPNSQQHPVVRAALDKLGLSKEEALAPAVDDPAIIKQLSDMGVPGIKYLDQGSRAHWANDAYVTKPDANGVYSINGAGISDKFQTKEAAQAALDNATASGPKPSSNYVVFKDDIINIIRKYAVAGIAVPPAIMAQYQKINEQQ